MTFELTQAIVLSRRFGWLHVQNVIAREVLLRTPPLGNHSLWTRGRHELPVLLRHCL